MEAWKPCDLILTTRLKVRDRAVAVCRIAPQAALLEQSLAMGHRRPAGSTTRSCRAWSSSVPAIHFKRPHRVSGLPATTLQFTGLVKVANADPRGDFLLFEARGRPGTTKESFCVSILVLMASEDFLPVSRVTSPFRAATTKGNRFTYSVDRSPEGSRIPWAYWCPKRRSASVRLKRSTMPWSLWMST